MPPVTAAAAPAAPACPHLAKLHATGVEFCASAHPGCCNDCTLGIKPGSTYAVFTTRGGAKISTHVECSGRRLREVLGDADGDADALERALERVPGFAEASEGAQAVLRCELAGAPLPPVADIMTGIELPEGSLWTLVSKFHGPAVGSLSCVWTTTCAELADMGEAVGAEPLAPGAKVTVEAYDGPGPDAARIFEPCSLTLRGVAGSGACTLTTAALSKEFAKRGLGQLDYFFFSPLVETVRGARKITALRMWVLKSGGGQKLPPCEW